MNSIQNNNSGNTLLAIILSLGFIIGAFIISSTWKYVSRSNVTVNVTGAASENIRSDLGVWKGSFSTNSATLATAFANLKSNRDKVNSYLLSKGFEQSKINLTSINTSTLYVSDNQGMPTEQISGYRLSQDVSIESGDVDKIDKLSREVTDLINEGVEITSFPAEFLYTKIGGLKIDLIGRAAKDAKQRAENIAESTGNSIGEIRSSKMGVVQINAKNSTEVSDYGMNNTSSIEKTVTSVVNVSFSIK
ncbi:MAG: SIMPL domain-containing protein [Ignavibacteria bacterium]|nr:SIMPL domain-containing protein [Ignavibacteria bacterium]